MERPLEIAFQGVDKSDAVAARITERVEKLENYSDRIIGCRVYVRSPHHSQHKGRRFTIDIELTTPLGQLVVGRKPGDNDAREDVYVAIRDAFNAMERQLKKQKDTHKSETPPHERPLQGRISELRYNQDHGHIATTDGRLIYFHKNSVTGADFLKLSVDDPVELSVFSGDSEKGPHATVVRPVSDLRFVDKAEKPRN